MSTIKTFLIEVWLVYNIPLISVVQQSDLVIHIYTFFYTIFHHVLAQEIGYSKVHTDHMGTLFRCRL